MSKEKRTNLRWSDNEWNQVTKNANTSHRKLPQYVKDCALNRLPTKVILSDKEYEQFYTEFRRIGNNVNQMARKINSGLRFGFSHPIQDLNNRLTELLQFIQSKYANN